MKVRLAIKIMLLMGALVGTNPGFAASVGPVSEETPPASCDPGWLVDEVRCTGDYCDNIQISCVRMGVTRIGSSVWTEWISEERGGRGSCPSRHYIAGFSCHGKYCDNISLYCVELRSVREVDCTETRVVSEEQGGRLSFYYGDTSGQRFAAKAMQCYGKYCDDKRFTVCELD